MDEDFFKDYPAADGSIPTATDTAPMQADDPMSAFIMGDAEPAAEPHEDSEEGANGGPADTATTDDEPECAAVTQWRVDFAKGLEEKVRKEREVKAERAERAAATLKAMHARWEKTSKEAADVNRKMEVEMIRERDAVISCMSKRGEQPNWDVVPKLVDMSGKFKEGARDTSRMRQVLLRMKTN